MPSDPQLTVDQKILTARAIRYYIDKRPDDLGDLTDLTHAHDKIMNSRAPETVITRGNVRFGFYKHTAAMIDRCRTTPGYIVFVMSPTHQSSHVAMDRVMELARTEQKFSGAIKNYARLEIRFSNGSIIYFRSNEDSLRGFHPDRVLMHEHTRFDKPPTPVYRWTPSGSFKEPRWAAEIANGGSF